MIRPSEPRLGWMQRAALLLLLPVAGDAGRDTKPPENSLLFPYRDPGPAAAPSPPSPRPGPAPRLDVCVES